MAIGGGSVMDAAKGIAILSGNGGSILEYAGVDQVMHPIPTLLMISTTSGTGADVSQFCIVTDTGRSVKIHRSAAAHHDARVAQGRRTDVDTSALIRAIRDISRGGSAFDARSAAAMVRGIHAGSVESDKKLTAREQEVLELLSRGMSNVEIGKKLFISDTTVKFHVGNILRKLGVSRRAEAVHLAGKMGLI